MEDFIRLHAAQLHQLNIPTVLYERLADQLQQTFVPAHDDNEIDWNAVVAQSLTSFNYINPSEVGSLLVFPHICSWDILKESNRGLFDSLGKLPTKTLQEVLRGLRELTSDEQRYVPEDRMELINHICDSRITWSRVILYRNPHGRVRGAFPAPPYPPQVQLTSATDTTEADLVGPFPFRYYGLSNKTVDCSLVYVNPNRKMAPHTIDLVPAYSAPNSLTRAVRYAALLGRDAPAFALEEVRRIHTDFVQRLHLVRQQALLQSETGSVGATTNEPDQVNKIWKVYTDANDPMELGDPEAGLSPSRYELTSSLEEADIIYSYQSLFAPGQLKAFIKSHQSIMINQFPYEGAFVQKDHLGREIQQQHGLPRPSWALETYDLDVQLAEFVGAATLFSERAGEDALWIVKPARGTRSKGHVVTKCPGQVLRIIDAGGESRVAQRYIEKPICYDGRKVDCRCIVMMTSAAPPGRPSLFMHRRVYFRIARKEHSISTASALVDHESILTAMHLLDTEDDDKLSRMLLPADVKTLAKLEQDYRDVGFQWNDTILPKIQTMIRELFNGMTKAYPAMGNSSRSRAIYGVDVMFEITPDGAEPKLTEVTFCPSNNAVCDAYERDDELYRSYNTDVFDCLFLGRLPDSIIKLQ